MRATQRADAAPDMAVTCVSSCGGSCPLEPRSGVLASSGLELLEGLEELELLEGLELLVCLELLLEGLGRPECSSWRSCRPDLQCAPPAGPAGGLGARVGPWPRLPRSNIAELAGREKHHPTLLHPRSARSAPTMAFRHSSPVWRGRR